MRVADWDYSWRSAAARAANIGGQMQGGKSKIKRDNLVRKGGLEPPRPYGRSHLKAVRLPISPLPQFAKTAVRVPAWKSCYEDLINLFLPEQVQPEQERAQPARKSAQGAS